MPKDSTPEKWIYQEHTRVKHELLGKYLKVWVSKLGSVHKRVCYFDGFAGRGDYEDKTLGSPIIAMRVANEVAKKRAGSEVVCVFIEKDLENYKNLNRIVQEYEPEYPCVKPQCVNGEFASVISDLLEDVGARLAPSFFFIDPFGFSGIPFRIIKDILSIQRTETFFTFMYRDISRFLALPNIEHVFDELFGTRIWREIISANLREEQREHALRELYVRQLREEAGARFTWAFRVCTESKFQTLYYLIHATNRFDGHDLMKSIMYKQGARGTFAYLGPEDFAAHHQMTLFPDTSNIASLKKYLLERFRGQKLAYDKVREESWETPFIDKHFREALKELIKEDKINISPVTSKTERGLRGQDKITFA